MPDNIKNDGGRAKRVMKEVFGYLIAIGSAVILAILIRIFIFEPFIVPTPSMEPTLMVGDRVIVNKLSYGFGSISRGDIIAFHSAIEDGKELVKRAIAIEGDEIVLTSEGEVFVNGERIEEEYLPGGRNISYLNQTVTVGEDEVFVMGDNRNNSFDSRYFGIIQEEDIFGEFLIVYWPPSRW
ncbi:MAG: signal peptidase I [Actinomycetia bacterium]|nr:signal peptidase I [Actinomycetes bacterium]